MNSLPDQNNFPLWKRLYIYQNERFPILGHGLLVCALSFSAVAYSRMCRHQAGFIDSSLFLLGIFNTVTLFLLLRIFDEFKDAQDDALYRKELPVPRGLVSLHELKWVGIIVFIPQLLINLIFLPSLLPLYFMIMIYLYFMSKEFYIKEWLKAHPFWYVTSHMFIVPFIDIYASALDWKMAGQSAPTGLIFFFAVSYMNGIVLEIGRKIRIPEKEAPGVNTYTTMLGTKKATLLWISVITLNCALSIAAAIYAHGSQAPWFIFGSLLFLFVIPGILFLIQPSERMSKWIEWSSILWTITMYFSLGAIPMIHQLLSN